MTASRWRSWASAAVSGLALACGTPPPPPFTPAETDAALAPARDLWSRCYVGSELERRNETATLDYSLNIGADGSVKSIPQRVDPDRPELVECVRTRLNQLQFPARAKDHIYVHFELGPRGPGAATPRAPREQALGTCEPPCADGFSCHYQPSAPGGVCRVTTGRCRFGRDCAPAQSCQRHTERLGVCVDPRP